VFEIGSNLRAAREQQKLELSDVERATRIRTKYLKALEDERFGVIPGTAYVKGFLRTYADFLGLDGPRFVDEFNERFAPPEVLDAPPPVRVPRPRRLPAAWLVAIPLAVAVGLFTWRVTSGGGKHPAARSPAAPHVRVRTAAPPVPAKPRIARVVLVAARGPCWLEVRSNGRRLYARTLEQGRRAVFTGRRIWIRIGAPWNLVATVNGKRAKLPSVTGNIVFTPS
jgi:hypothetical protein